MHKYVLAANILDEIPDNPTQSSYWCFVESWDGTDKYRGLYYNGLHKGMCYSEIIEVSDCSVSIRCTPTNIRGARFYIMLFDLTEMYGAGGEPSLSAFKETFSLPNYIYHK